MTDDVEACPYCRRPEIHERGSQRPRYKCLRCAKNFDEPIVREHGETTSRSWSNRRKLIDAEPDDFPPRGDA